MVQQHDRRVAMWLLFCCGMIFMMVMIGGVTRLTRSGLSMTSWKPIKGTLPPMSKAAWEKEFTRYKKFPEYQKVNHKMTLAEFKSIFWMEYFHRLWGRLIGLVFFFPFVFFWWRGWLRRDMIGQYVLMFIGGGLQGVLGWYMVKSGLVNRPSVSQYRLVAHLSAAFLLYAYLALVAWGLLYPKEEQQTTTETPQKEEDLRSITRSFFYVSLGVTTLLCVMILSGGFVAGLKAGHQYNTFPLMGGKWVPDGILAYTPWIRNFFENVATVQFTHRTLAYVLCLVVPGYWWYAQKFALSVRLRRAFHVLIGLFVLQVTLGLTTLLLHVPVPIAAMHQLGALCLFTVTLFINHQVKREVSTAPATSSVGQAEAVSTAQ